MANAYRKSAPGRYKVIAFSNDEVILDSGWFEVAAGEQRDVGALVTRPAGSVVIELARDATVAETEFVLYLVPEESVHARKIAVGGEERVLVPNLNPGRYSINAFGQDMAHPPTVFEVAEGVEALAKLELRGAVTFTFELTWPPEKALGWLRMIVTDAAGRAYMDLTENNTRPSPLRTAHRALNARALHGARRDVRRPRGVARVTDRGSRSGSGGARSGFALMNCDARLEPG